MGFYLEGEVYSANLFYCLLPQQIKLDSTEGTVQLMNFDPLGDTLKLGNPAFSLSSKLSLTP
jgi:hypothetical protein